MTSTDLRTRWATMTPRERDALVATSVLGWTDIHDADGWGHWVGMNPHRRNVEDTLPDELPDFTTDPALLLTLLGAIRYQWSVRYDPAGWGTFTVHADTPNEDDDGFVDHAARFETVSELPAAVALAALLSRGAD